MPALGLDALRRGTQYLVHPSFIEVASFTFVDEVHPLTRQGAVDEYLLPGDVADTAPVLGQEFDMRLEGPLG